ncbi:Mechanosensitive ion channel MscS [Dillenia turbinata]|uniref:Mechanosensitive ion channel MscS n=1 Tax=Dillenia turbinata TaxID=194707 RepID=A0AAN8VGK9_9MAGN
MEAKPKPPNQDEKKNDVVLQIPDPEEQPGTANYSTEENQPRISTSSQVSTTTSSPSRKAPLPKTLTRRKSAFVKPSRFGEQAAQFDPNMFGEENALDPGQDYPDSVKASPKVKVSGKGKAGDGEAIDYDDLCKRADKLNRKRHMKGKIKVLIEWTVFFIILGCLVATLTAEDLKHRMIWGLELWKWCVLIMVIFCGMFVTRWLMKILVFMIEMNFLLRKKVLYFVHGLKNSVQVFIWLALVLLTWVLLFKNGVDRSETTTKVLNYITWTIVSFLIGAFLWFLKTLLLKILASSFHVNTFFDRIQESIFHQYVLQTLSGPPVIENAEKVGKVKSSGQLSYAKNSKSGRERKETIDMAKLQEMKREKVSAWAMKTLMDFVSSSGLSTISNALDESFHHSAQADREITSEMEAMAAAYNIFKNVDKDNDNYIEEEDLLRFMIKEEVDLVFPLLQGPETGKIDQKSLTDWVVKVYQDRKALAHALSDTKTAVKQLNNLVTAILIVIVIVVWLLLMEIATTKVLVLLSSQLVVAAFMFGNTCKTIFEAIIFVFVMHPFDVGDRCVIDGTQMVVEEMNILTTVFLKFDNEKIYYPNSVLATKPISNYRRSPDMSDNVEFCIDLMTPIERIALFKSRIEMLLKSNTQYWHPNHSIVVKEIENLSKMKMALYFNHTMNFQNFPEKNKRRTELIIEMKKIFEDLKIKFSLLPQEVRLSNLDAVSNSSTK